jgi:hypothetical protein
MTPEQQQQAIYRHIVAGPKRIGAKLILLWPVAIMLVWAASHFRHPWLLASATAAVALLFCMVCVPTIGHVFALNKVYGGLKALRGKLVLADIGAVATLYALLALWLRWPLPAVATAAAFVATVITGLQT